MSALFIYGIFRDQKEIEYDIENFLLKQLFEEQSTEYIGQTHQFS